MLIWVFGYNLYWLNEHWIKNQQTTWKAILLIHSFFILSILFIFIAKFIIVGWQLVNKFLSPFINYFEKRNQQADWKVDNMVIIRKVRDCTQKINKYFESFSGLINLLFLWNEVKFWINWRADIAVNQAGWGPVIFGRTGRGFYGTGSKISYCDSLEKNKWIKNFFFNILFDIRCPARFFFRFAMK